MTPALVRDEELEAANSALSLTWQVGLVTGPLVAGMLIDRGGVHLALYADALSFLAMALALFGLPNAVKREDSAPGDADERGSVRTLLSYPIVLALTGLTFAFDSAYGPTEAALPVRLTETFHATALQFGSLWSGFGSGAMLGGLLAPLLARCLPIGLALAAIATTWGICQMGIAFAPGVAATLALFTIGGIIWGPYPALETSLIQRTVPQHLWGRVFGARTALLRPALPAGMALGGLLLRFFTPQMVIALSAGACLLAGVAGLCWRRLRRAGMPENALTSDSKAV
jgi:predicted MFS family arabinose efflux permease